MSTQAVKIPVCRVHPHTTVIYYEYSSKSCYNSNSDYSKPIMPYNSNRGRLSVQATGKIRKAANYLTFLAEEKRINTRSGGTGRTFKLAFITLTLPSAQVHSDNFLKSKVLNQFLTEMRQKYKVKRYIWVQEKQLNSNVHYHILIDKYIDWSELRDMWNRILNKYGYVDRYRERMRELHSSGFKVNQQLLKHWGVDAQIKAYHEGVRTNWNSPNSTDVHSVRKVHNIAAYVSKYFVKGRQRSIERVKKIDINFHSALETYQVSVSTGALKYLNSLAEKGRLWGCSYDLSNIKGAAEIVDSELAEEIGRLYKLKEVYSVNDTYFSCYFYDYDLLLKHRFYRLIEILDKYLFEEFNYSRQVTLSEF